MLATKTIKSRELTQELRVLADENRLKIIACLSSGEKCVCQLTDAVDIPQNLMSHHLKVLKKYGLVTDEHRGRWVYYTLKPNIVEDILAKIELYCQSNTLDITSHC
ncbi:MAG TPA: ArsR family transcriptional regulator [Actinobacteria bacterium]|nr:ArsR family transcriptional regulator [Actinomycetes bacterium]HEX21081.1 ArsR family transcriptional regulator [Actinomycetota bacterium]